MLALWAVVGVSSEGNGCFHGQSFRAKKGAGQETKGKAWRCFVGSEVLGTRLGVGKVGGQRLGAGL